ncbi:MAG: glycosyltransferase family 39 protein [Chloroflexota bacterium]|nr:glycosyltransferase family 39 protein [Chloroflexota bacterium]
MTASTSASPLAAAAAGLLGQASTSRTSLAFVPPESPEALTQSDKRMSVNPRTLTLGLVLLLATALRIAYLLDVWASPLFLMNALRGLDMGTYYQYALTFASGQLPDGATPFFQAPGYPLVLALFMRLGAGSIASLTAVQVVLGVVACVLLYELGCHLFSPGVGLVAAALYAVYPIAWYYGGLLLSENLLVVLLLAAALVAGHALDRPNMLSWLALGLICGLATLTRPNAAIVLPVLIALACVRPRRNVPVIPIASACVACGVLLLPAIVFNSFAVGSLQFVSTQGSHLWLSGNTAYASGIYQLPSGPALSPVSAQFWVLDARKFTLFFSNQEFGNNTFVGVFRDHLGPLINIPFGLGPLAGLGLVGLVVPPQNVRRWLPFALVLGLYVATIVAFSIVGRYRLPAAALLCLPAAALLVRMPSLLRSHPRRLGLAMSGVAILMLAANTNLPPDVSVPFAHANAAAVFAEAGDQVAADSERLQAHQARLAAEARDPHACLQLPPF